MTPDFVLQFQQFGRPKSWFIFDAKFSPQKYAAGERLDDIVLKYGHRLASSSQARNPVKVLSTIYPKTIKQGENAVGLVDLAIIHWKE